MIEGTQLAYQLNFSPSRLRDVNFINKLKCSVWYEDEVNVRAAVVAEEGGSNVEMGKQGGEVIQQSPLTDCRAGLMYNTSSELPCNGVVGKRLVISLCRAEPNLIIEIHEHADCLSNALTVDGVN